MGASGNLTGASALTGSTAILIDADGSIAGTGALVGTISLQFTLSASGTLQQAYSPLMYRPSRRWASREVDYRAYTDRVVIFPLKVATGIEGTASMTLDASAVLVGQAAIAGAGSLTFGATTSGGIAGAISLQFDCAAALLGIGELIGNASLFFGAAAVGSSVASVAGMSAMTLAASGALTDVSGIGISNGAAVTVRGANRTITVRGIDRTI